MDRRDALKKIAAGGATAAVATTVVSRPAFAAYDPPMFANPTVMVSSPGPNNPRVCQVMISLNASTCPVSAISPPDVEFVSAVLVPNAGSSSGNGFNQLGGTDQSFSVRQGPPGVPGRFIDTDFFFIDVTQRGRCEYNGGFGAFRDSTTRYRIDCTFPAAKTPGGVTRQFVASIA